jgi:hypothetical protein
MCVSRVYLKKTPASKTKSQSNQIANLHLKRQGGGRGGGGGEYADIKLKKG